MTNGPSDMRTVILDEAEMLFASKGVAETSLRDVTRSAGVNVAAVSYYFGGRDNLVRQVILRRVRPLNAERLELLDEAISAEEGPTMERVLRAFVAPAIRLRAQPGPGRDFVHLMGHLQTETSPVLRAIIAEEFREVYERFSDALRSFSPELSASALAVRLNFIVGALVGTLSCGHLVSMLDGEARSLDELDSEELIAHLVRFMEGGFLAGLPENPEGAER